MSFPILRSKLLTQVEDLEAIASDIEDGFIFWKNLGLAGCREITTEHGWPVGPLCVAILGEAMLTIQFAKEQKIASSDEFLNKIQREKLALSRWLHEDLVEANSQITLAIEKIFEIFDQTRNLCQPCDTRDLDEIIAVCGLLLQERDAIELISVGLESLSISEEALFRMATLDQELRRMFGIVEPRLKQNGKGHVLEALRIDWLPGQFWWRH